TLSVIRGPFPTDLSADGWHGLGQGMEGSVAEPGGGWGGELGSWKNKKRTFVDSLRVYVRGGPGGQGLAKFGGIGGDGGNVVVVARKGQQLINLPKKYPTRRFVAGSGGNSTKFCLLGEPGKDKELEVPPGVEIVTDEGEILGSLNEVDDQVCVARGGKGGNRDNLFLGKRGEGRVVNLNLKLIADVGLVGFPNAGKSTFLQAVSRAKPKIANYPFTTIRPQIGIAEFPDFRKISVADLPGLIEGAHANFGLGHRFLKHVERTKLLLFLVDINGFQLAQSYPLRSAFQTELELYRPDLLEKPAVLVVNKIDTDPSGHLTEQLLRNIKNLPDSAETVPEEICPETLIKFEDVITVSAKDRSNTDTVMQRVRTLLDVYADLKMAQQQKEKSVALQEEDIGDLRGRHSEQARKKLV
ncbi:hypothetical protein BaRGS_00000055, partial [Batillaria attramentaria]